MTQKGETLVEVKDLCKNFGVTIALSHVDFVVKTGEIRGLIGENGSGKSTVSSIIAGMQPASSGEMFYKGKRLKQYAPSMKPPFASATASWAACWI